MIAKLGRSALLGLAAVRAVHAHSQFTGLYVNGVGLGDATGIRMSDVQGAEGNPIAGLSSNEMACNVHGEKGVARVINVKATDTLTFEWRSWPDQAAQVPIDASHKGPCSVYLKKVDSALKDPGHGDGWFKIWHEGYDQATGKWCVDKLDDNRGHISVKLPANILGGYYLVRPEILALHAAQAPDYDPQFYTGCAQVFIDSDGDQVPAKIVSIPGHVSAKDPGLTFNIYGKSLAAYPIPGPAIATFKSAGGSKPTTAGDQKEGLRPANCVLVAGNLCLTELASYSNENGCWAALKDCFNQNENCWKNAGLSAMHYCQFWEDNKCKPLESACNSRKFTGPPNQGKDITPKPSTLPVNGLVGSPALQPTGNVAAAAPSSGTSSSTESAIKAGTADSAEPAKYSSTKTSSDNEYVEDEEEDKKTGVSTTEAGADGEEKDNNSSDYAAEISVDNDSENDGDDDVVPSPTRPAGARITKSPFRSGHRRHRGRWHSKKAACSSRVR